MSTIDEWDLELTNFTSHPTWKYAITPQTALCENCHENTGYFLTTQYVQERIDAGIIVDTEMTANLPVILDEIAELDDKEEE